MDIGSGAGYPSAALSNFAPHAFELDGVECASMEGFLQSLKFENPEMQRQVCTLVGKSAPLSARPQSLRAKRKSGLRHRHFTGTEKL